MSKGACAARLIVSGKPHSFTCFVRDINRKYPIYIPDYGVVLTEAVDTRSYVEIEGAILKRGLAGKQQQIEAEPEETYENACAHTRNMMCPAWLGLGRDMRFFEVGYDPKFGYWGYVQPRYHSTLQNIPETGDKPYSIAFAVGSGASCRSDITRRLEDGVLPILHSTQREENVHYHLTAFCTLEKQELSSKTVRGSEWQACYPNTGGNMLSQEEREKLKDLLYEEMRRREEETICAIRVEAANVTSVPQYAWFKGCFLHGVPVKTVKDKSNVGFVTLESGRVLAVLGLNGEPLPDEEIAVLLQPGETAVFQNFGGYQLETGPALWTMGEHYRYTRDDAWVNRIQPKLLKACEYLLQWRERNKRPELRGRGYGLLDGKVADPNDFFHSFMLNGLSYIGIQRVAEMLAQVNPAEAKRLRREAEEFGKDIRTAFYGALARSPVIPLDDGTWVPSVPPWTEYPGPVALYAEGGNWFSHGAFFCRDSLVGSLYLVISEVLDAKEVGADFLLKSHQQLMTVRNAGLSQPYYCRHDYIHLKRGEVKAFLKTYYNQFASLQDRETYTFWEHYFHASQHKTHEEGWFLMQTRWMLWLEEGRILKLLQGIPRSWLGNGKSMEIKNAASYFGKISVSVKSRLEKGVITAIVECGSDRKPDRIEIRLPHPEGRKAVKAEGGVYDAANETVQIAPFKGRAEVTIFFQTPNEN